MKTYITNGETKQTYEFDRTIRIHFVKEGESPSMLRMSTNTFYEMCVAFAKKLSGNPGAVTIDIKK